MPVRPVYGLFISDCQRAFCLYYIKGWFFELKNPVLKPKIKGQNRPRNRSKTPTKNGDPPPEGRGTGFKSQISVLALGVKNFTRDPLKPLGGRRIVLSLKDGKFKPSYYCIKGPDGVIIRLRLRPRLGFKAKHPMTEVER